MYQFLFWYGSGLDVGGQRTLSNSDTWVACGSAARASVTYCKLRPVVSGSSERAFLSFPALSTLVIPAGANGSHKHPQLVKGISRSTLHLKLHIENGLYILAIFDLVDPPICFSIRELPDMLLAQRIGLRL
jgi:hypothetical protein